MKIVVDRILADVLMHDHLVNEVATAPATGSRGQLIFDNSDKSFKLWDYGWNTLHSFIKYLLQENGDFLLQENGSKLILD